MTPFGATEPALHRIRAVIGHAVAFATWQSLCLQHGLSDDDAVNAMTALALAVAQPRDLPASPAAGTAATVSRTPGTTR